MNCMRLTRHRFLNCLMIVARLRDVKSVPQGDAVVDAAAAAVSAAWRLSHFCCCSCSCCRCSYRCCSRARRRRAHRTPRATTANCDSARSPSRATTCPGSDTSTERHRRSDTYTQTSHPEKSSPSARILWSSVFLNSFLDICKYYSIILMLCILLYQLIIYMQSYCF